MKNLRRIILDRYRIVVGLIVLVWASIIVLTYASVTGPYGVITGVMWVCGAVLIMATGTILHLGKCGDNIE